MSATFGGIRSQRESLIWHVVNYAILIAISVATVVPFLFMASTSFTKSFTMMSYPPQLIPDNPSWGNY
jgi:ABC-type glycerol-3-phosphate transport system permease component